MRVSASEIDRFVQEHTVPAGRHLYTVPDGDAAGR